MARSRVHSDATTPEEYLAGLPDERRPIVEAVRQVILENLPDGFEETIDFGMLSYVVPLERYPNTYNGHPLGVVALANQKRHLSLYLNAVYSDDAGEHSLRESWEATGRRLDMGRTACASRPSTTSRSISWRRWSPRPRWPTSLPRTSARGLSRATGAR